MLVHYFLQSLYFRVYSSQLYTHRYKKDTVPFEIMFDVAAEDTEDLTPQPPSQPSRSPLQGEMADDEAFYFTEEGA
jgi:hypothetical protein